MFFPLRDENPSPVTPVVTYSIILANILALVWLQWLPDEQQQLVVLQRGFLPARIQQMRHGQPLSVDIDRTGQHPHLPVLVRFRQEVTLPVDVRAVVSSIFTSMFLHGGWLHLISNMWFLLIFGNNLEERLGHVGFGLFYLAGGVIAALVHWLPEPGSLVPVIGASGAVAAVLGGYAILFPHARIRTLVFLFVFVTIIDLPALVVLGFWFVSQLLNATQAVRLGINGGVAWWAHVGGFIAGLLFIPLFVDRRPPPSDRSTLDDSGIDWQP